MATAAPSMRQGSSQGSGGVGQGSRSRSRETSSQPPSFDSEALSSTPTRSGASTPQPGPSGLADGPNVSPVRPQVQKRQQKRIFDSVYMMLQAALHDVSFDGDMEPNTDVAARALFRWYIKLQDAIRAIEETIDGLLEKHHLFLRMKLAMKQKAEEADRWLNYHQGQEIDLIERIEEARQENQQLQNRLRESMQAPRADPGRPAQLLSRPSPQQRSRSRSRHEEDGRPPSAHGGSPLQDLNRPSPRHSPRAQNQTRGTSSSGPEPSYRSPQSPRAQPQMPVQDLNRRWGPGDFAQQLPRAQPERPAMDFNRRMNLAEMLNAQNRPQGPPSSGSDQSHMPSSGQSSRGTLSSGPDPSSRSPSPAGAYGTAYGEDPWDEGCF